MYFSVEKQVENFIILFVSSYFEKYILGGVLFFIKLPRVLLYYSLISLLKIIRDPCVCLPESFDHIFSLVEALMIKKSTTLGEPISPAERLSLTLRSELQEVVRHPCDLPIVLEERLSVTL